MAVNVGGSGIRFLLQVVLARALGIAPYGQFVLGRSWGELLSRFPNAGYEAAAVKELPRHERNGEGGLHHGFVRRASAVTASSAVLMTVVAIGISALVTGADRVIVLGLLLTAPLALVTLHRALLQGHHRFVSGSALVELVQPLAFAAVVAVLWIVDRLTVVTALLAWIGTMAVAAAAGAVMLRAARPDHLRSAPPQIAADHWRPTRRALFASRLAFVVLDGADILIVGAVLGPADVAAYAIATRVAVLGRIIVSGVQSVAASHIADAAAGGDLREVQHIVDRSLRVCALPSVALTLVTAAFAPVIVGVFGDDASPAVDLLRILLIGNLVNSVTGPSGYVVSLGGLERRYAAVMWSAAAATLALVPVGCVWFGAAGAAWIVTSVITGWNLALLVIARRHLGVRCWIRPATYRDDSDRPTISNRGSHT